MRRAAILFLLKCQSLLGRRSAWLMFLLLPLLMTLPGGLAERGNEASSLRAVLVDEAQNDDSRLLAETLRQSDVTWLFLDHAAALRSLRDEEADALVSIPPDFSLPDRPSVILESSRRPEALQVLVEDLAGGILPLAAGEKMLASLRETAARQGMSEASLKRRFVEQLQKKMTSGYQIRLKLVGETLEPRRTLLALPRWSPELLFLSLYSILACLGQARQERRRRLLSSPNAFVLDQLSGLGALLFLGSLQIFLVLFMLKAVFPPFSASPRTFLILFSFLCSQILVAQFILLLPEQHQLLTALFLLFFSAFAGGAFVPLPSHLMKAFGLYFPHGRALALLEGMPVRHLLPWLLPLFFLASFLQREQLLRS